MTARFLFFGEDAFADTFYSIGLVMQICQLLSVLEIGHTLVDIENCRILPVFLQVMERLVILFGVITSQEEVQSKCIVCALFFIWNLWDVIRYPYQLLATVGIDYPILTWLKHTFWIPVYPLAVMAEAYTVYESLPYFEALGTYSFKIALPVSVSVYFPYILKAFLLTLPAGMFYKCNYRWSERKRCLQAKKLKDKHN
ncbi:hypothetical protein GDO86_001339 [Hymenochirus boettgeri]|uniref:Very-long-chain (3R)-3-hydroxyacyl-CoA dehydratase n=1 Tax=Hymenochirus boettgeri TaxID=247094 RepID=A0A8T2KL16_9PIPI|nr:hypothetical protein GDO86_001339 [Hymenochirus boettgeri]